MKESQGNGAAHMRAENKDTLDSRHREEEMVKKNHITNNTKEHRSENKTHSKK